MRFLLASPFRGDLSSHNCLRPVASRVGMDAPKSERMRGIPWSQAIVDSLLHNGGLYRPNTRGYVWFYLMQHFGG